ncbi:hypothetical protein PBCV1_a663R [Paramecium bursaria Chlorella virus 1]|uniref:Uncharacterized protein n=1 Tax=Paramecium bursaria Chlorella virus 1 TaxID=10506 RepID=O41145_PBCV1|nr:hypothetical protein PBCV1_a663R [Paramecium bursaria Chlorella virus 1]AAC97043.2 hypothetical protein [Paramecium bursaria Chlorella virus 1]
MGSLRNIRNSYHKEYKKSIKRLHCRYNTFTESTLFRCKYSLGIQLRILWIVRVTKCLRHIFPVLFRPEQLLKFASQLRN